MAVADEPLLLLERRLQAWRRARPRLGPAVDFEARVIRESLRTPQPVETQPFALPREHLIARLREGVPLLHDQPVHLDIRFASDLFGGLVALLGHRARREDPGEHWADTVERSRFDGLIAAWRSGQLDPQRLFSEAFVRHADHLAEIALELGIDAQPLTALAERAAAPLLRAYAGRLLPMVERLDDGSATAAVWRQGYCPVCGGWPALAAQRGVEPMRHLRCAACASGWRAGSLACPYCGNADPASLPTLIANNDDNDDNDDEDDGPGQHVAACDRCTGYLKVIDTPDATDTPHAPNTFDAAPSELLTLDAVATQFLDDLAVERGYQRPAGSGFRIELAVPDEDWPDELADG